MGVSKLLMMLSKEEKEQYRMYLLQQMADNDHKRRREKEERLGGLASNLQKHAANKVQVITTQPSGITVLPQPISSRHLVNLDGLNHRRQMTVTKEYDIKIGTPPVYLQPHLTSKPSSSQHQTDAMRSYLPTSTTRWGQNILAVENMDPYRIEQVVRRKSEMQEYLLQQMQEQRSAKAEEKRKRIEEERRLQDSIQQKYQNETGGFEKRSGRKRVTIEDYFPNTVSGPQAQTSNQVRATSSERKSVVASESRMEKVRSLRRFDVSPIVATTTPRHPNPPQSLSHLLQISNKYTPQLLSEEQQMLGHSSPRSHRSQSLHPNDYQQQLSASRGSNVYEMNINCHPRVLPSESETESQSTQKYEKIAQELKKVRHEILAQRELMATLIAKANLDQEKKHLIQLAMQPTSPRSSHRSSHRPVRKHKPLKRSNYTDNTQSAQDSHFAENGDSQLACESKMIPLAIEEEGQGMTMSRIDNFAVGVGRSRKQLEEPSFTFRNQFLESRESGGKVFNRGTSPSHGSQYLQTGGGHDASKETRSPRGAREEGRKSVYFQTDS